MSARACGACTLCCTLVPVGEIGKPAYRACRHLASPFLLGAAAGCTVYPTRPRSCRTWSCLWVSSAPSPGDDGMPEELRPDRCGVVFDPVMDICMVNDREIVVGQVWVRAGREMAFAEPAIGGALMGMLNQVEGVLWQLPPNAAGSIARIIMKGPDGRLIVGPESPASPNAMGGYAARQRRLVERGKSV